MMKKPVITLEKIEYTPIQGDPYPVYVINGPQKYGFAQGSLCCTGCGKRHQYRWYEDSRWVKFKCPTCDTVSAWFEEYDEEDDEE